MTSSPRLPNTPNYPNLRQRVLNASVQSPNMSIRRNTVGPSANMQSMSPMNSPMGQNHRRPGVMSPVRGKILIILI